MMDAETSAYINLYGLLGNLVNLCQLDSEAKSLLPKKAVSVGFVIYKGPSLALRFEATSGCQRLDASALSQNIVLVFRSVRHFNAMMSGKAMPIIVKGFTKLRFLTGTFSHLSQRLEHFLKPQPQYLNDNQFNDISTRLTLFTAVVAAAQIGNHDPEVKAITGALSDGNIALTVKGGPSLEVQVRTHQFTVTEQIKDRANAYMEFADLGTVGDLLAGRIDAFSAIASNKIQLAGFIPLLDGFDKLLFRVNYYLKQES
ncbi:hypothetical protein [Gallaecimonas mangrovi]|uniref:hypothetical protein n=1 Tax=Gallaecimonas mangrovi TaxID=2291597 RepID=UPI000E2008DC|nr:hypothetical protein [Gallaecimonas mangrovi]